MPELILGPVLRYVDATQATVWVQTDAPCEVQVLGHRARTFAVEGQHFALVAVGGLEPGSRTPYAVALDGREVWPVSGGGFGPPSVIATAGARRGERRLRLAFGSCREIAPHEAPYTLDDADHPSAHGIDALRTLALDLARGPSDELPDALLMLGDQLYADEPPDRLTDALRRRDEDGAIDVRAVTFEDYSALYRLSWDDPAVRWLLSTVPSMMIFDDHEIIDEWQMSQAWLDERRQRPEYEQRVTAGLMAYWVFQHVGNLSPAELDRDDVAARLHDVADAGPMLRSFAADADRHARLSRWSFCRDFGRVRVLVLDSRAARRLEPGRRRLIDEAEWAWAVERARDVADIDHLVIASSLPMLLPAGVHHAEAGLERLADGARGRLVARGAERLKRALNLGHWASFQFSFRALAALLEELAAPRDGAPGPVSIVLLSGDVHHGYLARWRGRSGTASIPVWQVVCSPFRKRLNRYERQAMRLGASLAAVGLGGAVARLAGLPVRKVPWRIHEQPDNRNQVGILDVSGASVSVALRTPEGSPWQDPRLRTMWERRLA